MHFLEIERFQWNQPVFDWIVQMTLHSGAVMIVMFQVHPPFAKHYFTRSPRDIATTTGRKPGSEN
jgi:hypothetical protein